MSSYINIHIFLVLYFGAKFYVTSKIIPMDQMSTRHFIDIANSETEEAVPPKKGWQRLNILRS